MSVEFKNAIISFVFILVGFISYRINKRKQNIKDRSFWPSFMFAGIGILLLGVSIFGESSEDFNIRKSNETYDSQSVENSNIVSEPSNNSSSSSSNIVLCPKCGKSYNKETWGEMCNTCWSAGKGLKNKDGSYILK